MLVQAATEAIYITAIFLLGAMALMACFKELKLGLLLAAALPIGSIIWMFLFMLAGFMLEDLDTKFLVLIAYGLVGGGFVFIWWKRKIQLRELGIPMAMAAAVALIVFAIGFVPYNLVHTNDSFLIRDAGKLWLHPSLAFDDTRITELKAYEEGPPKHLLAAYGFLQTSIQGADFVSHVRLFIPGFSLASVAVCGLLFWFALPGAQGRRQKMLPLVACLLVLLSTYFYLLHSVYLHTNLLAACFLAMAVLAFVAFRQTRQEEFARLSFLLLLGYSFSRTESPIFFLVVLFLLLGNQPVSMRTTRRLLTPILLIIASWHVYIYWELATFGPSRADVLSPTTALLVTFAFCGVAGGLQILIPAKWHSMLPRAILLSLAGAILLIVIGMGRTGELGFLFQNMFTERGAWGPGWFFLIAAWFTFPRSHGPNEKLLEQVAIAVFMLIVLAGVVAGRYRLGWSDSGNRMLLQVFLLGLSIFVMRLHGLLQAEVSDDSF